MTKFDVRPRVAWIALAALLGPAAALPADAAPAGPLQQSPPGQGYTVTLVTGDKVRVASAAATRAVVEPGPGREALTFATSSLGGHLRVIPSDAARLVQTKRVDRRLFDVTELIRLGYDDAHRSDVPVIVRSKDAATLPRVTQNLRARGAQPNRDLSALRSVALKAPKSRNIWSSLTSDTVQTVWLDGKRKPLLDRGTAQINAPAAWQAGLTGQGMTVAVLDTGVDDTHPDLTGRVTSKSFTEGEGEGDIDGHGTHVASIIAGDGTASGGKYRGVAPDAEILAGKVCGTHFCEDSAILAGMQWAAAEQRAKVINMSLGGTDTPSIDPLEEAVDTLSAQTGALFVVAAGNEGPGAGTVGSPGSADAALTVAAVDRDDTVAPFSSRGPRTGDSAVKPDIAAPGVDIVAARASGTESGTPDAQFPDSYVAISGTSMATPHVAGAAVLLAQRHPDWSGSQLKAALMASAERTPGEPYEIGAGRTDLARALTQTVVSQPSSVSFGLQGWPHDNDTPVTKTVTYRNLGDAAVTLDLAVTGFALSAASVTVPAGGTAGVDVTADTRALEPGLHQGHLVATGGATRVVTPVAIEKETEKYNLTLKHIGLDGQPVENYLTQIYRPGYDGDFYVPWDPSGTVTIRLPKGRFTLGTYLYEPSGVSDIIFQPVLDMTKDTTVVFDARKTTTASQSVPEKDAVSRNAFITIEGQVDGKPISYGEGGTSFANLRFGRSDGGNGDGLTAHVDSVWLRGGDEAASPYAYFAADTVPGPTLFGGYHRAFTRADFAAVTETFRGGGAGTESNHWHVALDAAGDYAVAGAPRVTVPGTRTSYLIGDPSLTWESGADIGYDIASGNVLHAPLRSYRAGEKVTDTWGAAPHAMTFEGRIAWMQRYQDRMNVNLPDKGDGAGHSGYDMSEPMTIKLFRGDALVASSDEGGGVYAEGLPPEKSTYRVEGVRGGTTTALTWKSAAPESDVVVNLPVFAVRYQPRLDATDTAHGADAIALTPTGLAGAAVALRSLTFEVSYDDGRTWKALPVVGGKAPVVYPKGSGFVSTRISAVNTEGGTFRQTVLRAYKYAK